MFTCKINDDKIKIIYFGVTLPGPPKVMKTKKKITKNNGILSREEDLDSQRKSITSRPSPSRPVPLWKNVMPWGRPTGRPVPARTPPVSELESPKLIRMGLILWPHSEFGTIPRKTITHPSKMRRENPKQPCIFLDLHTERTKQD